MATLTVYTGPMFSGKSTALIGAYNDYGGRKQMFSSSLDDRYGKDKTISHDGLAVDAVCVADTDSIAKSVRCDTEAVFIDEAHLIAGDLRRLCVDLLDRGISVYVAALDLDYRAEPFIQTAMLMCLADTVVKKSGRCSVCGRPSRYSRRISDSADRILVGGTGDYVPVCRLSLIHISEPTRP